jgi:transcriptional regulator with XRE-family HTH domain
VTSNDYQVLVAQEEFILAATELIFELMEKTGVTKAELARRVGRTRGYLTQLLDGNRNMTLRTLAELANALGYRPRLDALPRSAKRQPASRA